MCLNNVRNSEETDHENTLDVSSIFDCNIDVLDTCKLTEACDIVKEGDLTILHLNIRSLQ